MTTPNQDYMAFERAFKFFNRKLFSNTLPMPLLTLRADGKARAYFQSNTFVSRTTKELVHEIAINPASGIGLRDDKEILSTLVHEMTHVEEVLNGTASSGPYHNKIWADRMDSLGLPPHSSDGLGKRTGNSMTHSITEGGPFDVAATEFLKRHKGPGWAEVSTATDFSNIDLPPDLVATLASLNGQKEKRRRQQQKVKYQCPACNDAKVWGKPGLSIMHNGTCNEVMVEVAK
jgi:hypothetical protein